jgi:putative copper resistance protein D
VGFEDELRNVAYTLLRFTAFSSHAFLFGLVPMLLLVIRPSFAAVEDPEAWRKGRSRFAGRLERLTQAALIASVLSTVLTLLLQAALISELSPSGEISSGAFSSVVDTPFGRWHALRLPLAAGLAVLLVGRVRLWSLKGAAPGEKSPGAVWWGLWALLGAALLATTTFSGHSTVAKPPALAVVNDITHLMFSATWFAGIIILAVALPDGWIDRGASARLQLLAPAISRFARVAMITITVVAVTGTLNSFLHIGRLDDMFDSTYGQTLSVKILFFIGILAFGGVNHYVVEKRLAVAHATGTEKDAVLVFRKTIAAELAIALTVMLLTGLLTGLSRTKGSTDALLARRGVRAELLL